MTQFGVHSSFSSPAAKRILAAGKRHEAPEAAPRLWRMPDSPEARARRALFFERVERDRKTVRAVRSGIPTSAADIMEEVCTKHDISLIELRSVRRAARLVLARHEAMWRMHHETSLSYPAIGRILGGRDHTTVMHGVRRFQARLDGAKRANDNRVYDEVRFDG